MKRSRNNYTPITQGYRGLKTCFEFWSWTVLLTLQACIHLFVEHVMWTRKTKVNNFCLSFSRCILRIKTTVSNCVKYVPFESPAHEVASCMGRGQQIYQPLPEHPGCSPLLIQKHRKGARWGCTGPFNFSLASPFHLMGGGGAISDVNLELIHHWMKKVHYMCPCFAPLSTMMT